MTKQYSMSIHGEAPSGERFYASLDFEHPALLDVRLRALADAASALAGGTFTNADVDSPHFSRECGGCDECGGYDCGK